VVEAKNAENTVRRQKQGPRPQPGFESKIRVRGQKQCSTPKKGSDANNRVQGQNQWSRPKTPKTRSDAENRVRGHNQGSSPKSGFEPKNSVQRRKKGPTPKPGFEAKNRCQVKTRFRGANLGPMSKRGSSPNAYQGGPYTMVKAKIRLGSQNQCHQPWLPKLRSKAKPGFKDV
jgi:hypothetical protein